MLSSLALTLIPAYIAILHWYCSLSNVDDEPFAVDALFLAVPHLDLLHSVFFSDMPKTNGSLHSTLMLNGMISF